MKSIKENQEKSNSRDIWGWYSTYRQQILYSLIVLLVAVSSYGLGRIETSITERKPVSIIPPTSLVEATVQSSAPTNIGSPAPQVKAYVAAKTGKAYYLPWCGSVNRIKEENKVWFATKEEAEQAGYRPAANCPGM